MASDRRAGYPASGRPLPANPRPLFRRPRELRLMDRPAPSYTVPFGIWRRVRG